MVGLWGRTGAFGPKLRSLLCSIDCLGISPSGSLVIIDWKRSKKIDGNDYKFDPMLPPLNHLEDCKLNRFKLQLNLYRFIIESEYELQVEAMYICVLHPCQQCFHLIEVPDMHAEIRAISNYLVTRCGSQAPIPGPCASFVVFDKLFNLHV